MLKLVGYLVSSVSVICLGVVSWSGAAKHPWLLAVLILGMATSILGMAIRFRSYMREKQEQRAQTLISK